MTISRSFWVLIMLLALPRVCSAGIGTGSSPATLVDTAPPIINLDILPPNTSIHAGQQLNFHWTSTDDHPGTDSSNFEAIISTDQAMIDSITWFPLINEFTWNWTGPEIQSPFYHLSVSAMDVMGNRTTVESDYFTVLLSTTSSPDIPTVVDFQSPYPNPFNPSCELVFSLPASEYVELDIFDARGRKVRNLIRGTVAAGRIETRWDGTDQQGRSQSGGVYFFVLKTNGADGPVKMVRKATLIP